MLQYFKDNFSKEQNRVELNSSAYLSNIPQSKYEIFRCRIDPGKPNLPMQ
jgi:hypothetical protein